MKSLICDDCETKSIRQRWQISYKAKPGKRGSGREFKVCRSAESAVQKSNELFVHGIKSKIEPVFTDFYIVSNRGEIFLAHGRMLPLEAAKIANAYSKVDRIAGVLLWPHGLKLPRSLQKRVVVADEETEVAS